MVRPLNTFSSRRGAGRGLNGDLGGFGRGGRMLNGRGVLPARRPLGVNTRASSYTIAKSFSRTKDSIWKHDLYDSAMRPSDLESGTKLYISNLDYGVSNDDIKELFSEIGHLKRYTVHFDGYGRSNGSAEVVFTRRSDAFAALRRYNNVLLDGKAMKIEVVGADKPLPMTPRVNVVGATNGRGRRTVVMTPEFRRQGVATSNRVRVVMPAAPQGGRGRGGVRGRGRGRYDRGRGRGRGGRKQGGEKTVEELNKELESYHAEAMRS